MTKHTSMKRQNTTNTLMKKLNINIWKTKTNSVIMINKNFPCHKKNFQIWKHYQFTGLYKKQAFKKASLGVLLHKEHIPKTTLLALSIYNNKS